MKALTFITFKKNLGVSLTKDVKISNENFLSPKKETERDTRRSKDSHAHGLIELMLWK